MGSGEHIYWSGKKSIKVSVLEAIFKRISVIVFPYSSYAGVDLHWWGNNFCHES